MASDVTIRVAFGRGAPDVQDLTNLIEDEYEDAVVTGVDVEED